MRKDYHLVLSFDTPNEELQKTLLEIVKGAGREIETAAKLAHGAINDGGGKPSVMMYSDDFLMGKEEFEIGEEAEAKSAGEAPTSEEKAGKKSKTKSG